MPTDRVLESKEVQAYVSVLFEAAAAEKAEYTVAVELEDALQAIRGHKDLHNALKGNDLDAEGKKTLLKAVFEGFNACLIEVLSVMAARGAIDLLARVLDGYTALLEEANNVVFVGVTTAVSLDDHLREVIKKKLSAEFGRDIVLHERIDTSILGGIVLSAHGKKIDASVTTQLEAARVTLSTAKAVTDEETSGGEE
jgi:F-type H+-transporting ATPase subunit delta